MKILNLDFTLSKSFKTFFLIFLSFLLSINVSSAKTNKLTKKERSKLHRIVVIILNEKVIPLEPRLEHSIGYSTGGHLEESVKLFGGGSITRSKLRIETEYAVEKVTQCVKNKYGSTQYATNRFKQIFLENYAKSNPIELIFIADEDKKINWENKDVTALIEKYKVDAALLLKGSYQAGISPGMLIDYKVVASSFYYSEIYDVKMNLIYSTGYQRGAVFTLKNPFNILFHEHEPTNFCEEYTADYERLIEEKTQKCFNEVMGIKK